MASEQVASRYAEPESDLIGREADVALVRRLLSDPAVRLVTLTGPGGIGKTRLAERVVAEFNGTGERRVVVVMLAPIGETEGVLPAVARALGVVPASGEPLTAAVLAAFGAGDDLLLVLDNLEHLAGVETIVAELCTAAPRLSVLATSRSRLGLRLEHVVEVAPLAVPQAGTGCDPCSLAGVAAVTLFTRRVREVLPGFAVTPGNAGAVAAICRRLDGVPLAIELVASRGRSLSPEEILARLEAQRPLPVRPSGDLPDRQRSIEASIWWSFDLLPEAARDGLARLAVFPGTFAMDGAVAVAVADELTIEVLLDHHLVARVPTDDGPTQFRLAEPIKQFGIERLREAGIEEAVRDRHAMYVLDAAERLAARYRTDDEPAVLAEAARLRNDAFAALAWTTTGGDPLVAARIAVSMTLPWVRGVDWATSHRWAHRVLAAVRTVERVDDELLAQVLVQAAITSYHVERLEESERCAAEAVEVARRQGNRWVTVRACTFRCQTLTALGELERAAVVQGEMLDLAAELDDPLITFDALVAAGMLALFRGSLEQADKMLRAAIASARTVGRTLGVAHVAHFLGYVAALQGDFARGRAVLLESLALLDGGDESFALPAVWGMGRLELLANRPKEAAAWLARVLGGRFARGEVQRSRDALLDSAWLALLARRPEVAARFFGSGDSVSAPIERNRLMAPLWRAAEAATRDQLGEAAFRSAYQRGQILLLDRAVEEALAFAQEVQAGSIDASTEGEEPATASGSALAGSLSSREIEVLRLVMAGMSDREIGRALFISPQTASKHVKNILRKLKVPSRTAAAMAAIQLGLKGRDS